MTINEKMNKAVESDNFTKIENIALNPKNAYVNVSKFNIFTGKAWREWEWIDVSSVIKKEDYFEDLSGECQDYVMQLDKYKNMDYDKIVEDYDKPIEKKNDESLKYFEDLIDKRKKHNKPIKEYKALI
jgi:hypothetical protein